MRYYKIEATVLSDVEIPRKKSDVFDEFADNMRSLSQTFYIKSDKKDYVFTISTGNNNVIYFGAIINERGNIKSVLDNYMKLCNSCNNFCNRHKVSNVIFSVTVHIGIEKSLTFNVLYACDVLGKKHKVGNVYFSVKVYVAEL